MAGYTVSAQVIGAKEMAEVFAKAKKVVVENFGEALINTSHRIESKAKQYSPVNLGTLRASIHAAGKVYETQNNIETYVGTNVKYAPFMEYGTRPHWPNIDAIEKWADKKFIKAIPGRSLKVKNQRRNVAFLIARAISRRGTKPREFFKRSYEESQQYFTSEMKRALAAVTDYLATAKP